MANELTAGERTASTSGPVPQTGPWHPSPNTVLAGILCWAAISAGFFGLGVLMETRPEFIGQPVSGPKAELIQESPRIVARKSSDDVSIIKPMQPEQSDVRFDLAGRRDYRGLRTIMDMSGGFQARYVLTNPLEEAQFVLFKCPHPRTGTADSGNLPASGLRLQSSIPGAQENAADAWLWSGVLEPHAAANIDISYQAASLRRATYHVGEENGSPVKQLRVAFHRQDLQSMRFESADGAKPAADETVTWERREFLAPDFYSGTIMESRNLYQALRQLLEIGPGLCLLFLLAVSAVIFGRQEMNAVQMGTLAIGYALYFPLILYLSAHLSFPLAVAVSAIVPGALLFNYARWLLGPRLGLLGGVPFLALYWVFPTLAAFASWNRGLVLLCLGVVTLYVLMNLQNQTLRRKAAAVVALLLLVAFPGVVSAADVQVILPGELLPKTESKPERAPGLISIAPAQYQIRQDSNYFHVEAQAPFQVLHAGEPYTPLFTVPVYLLESHVESAQTNLAWFVSATNGLRLTAESVGSGALRLIYRVPIENREGKHRAEIPMLAGVSGSVRLEADRGEFQILAGSVWSKSSTVSRMVYDIGVTGEEKLVIEWRDHSKEVTAETPQPTSPKPAAISKPVEPARDFYGIGLTRAQHLTIINSDGSCTHFAEFEMPAFQGGEFRLKLPAQAKLISASVNGNEVQSPALEDQTCRIKLPGREAQQTVNRLSFRIAYAPMRLGFIGTAELTLPEVFQTSATTEWVVALPSGFEAQVVSSGLETQKSSPDLARFGDYGRVLQSHVVTSLSKDLTPPGLIGLSLKYRQIVHGISDSLR